MRAIITRYLGPTNHRPSRVKAYAGKAGSVTVPWDYSLPDNITANHRSAALALMDMLRWDDLIRDYDMVTGSTDDFYVHLMVRRG